MAGIANLQINIDARGAIQKLREFTQGSRSAAAASQELSRGADAAGESLRNEGRAAGAAGNQLGQLVGAVGKLTAAYVGLRTVQASVQASIQRAESERRLQFLAQSYGELAGVQEAAARAGTKFGLSITQANKDFADLYGRLRPLNVSLSDIEAAFVGFNTAAIASGTSSAEAAGAMRQLSQALGSGVLRGDELNSVLEQAPGLVSALTKELGKPVTEIRKLAQEGKITSDVVIRALKRAGAEGAGSLESAMNGPAQAIKNLQNEFENFQVAATEDLIPAVVKALRGMRELLVSLAPVIRGLGGIAAQTLGTISDLITAATNSKQFAAAQAIRGGRLPLAGLGGIEGAGELFKGTSGAGGVGLSGIRAEAEQLAKMRRQPVTTVLLQLMQNRLARMDTAAKPSTPAITTPPPLGSMVGGGAAGGGRAGGDGKADKAASDRERTAQLVAESAQSALYAREQFKIFQRTITAQKENNQQLIIARETQKELLGISRQIDDVRRNKELPDAAKLNQLEALKYKAKEVTLKFAYDIGIEEEKQSKAVDERLAGLAALAEQYSKNLDLNVALTAEQEKQKILADTITSSVGQGLTTAFNGLIQGTEEFGSSLRKIASGVLVDIANQLLRIYVINQVTGLIGNLLGPRAGGFMSGTKFNPAAFAMPQLVPGLPARAMGGPVTAGQPYLVGERGPEMFVPSGGGNVLPSGKGGGNVTVNVSVDATGSQVAGDNEQASQLGRVIAAAVQSELIKAKRPGGILNS